MTPRVVSVDARNYLVGSLAAQYDRVLVDQEPVVDVVRPIGARVARWFTDAGLVPVFVLDNETPPALKVETIRQRVEAKAQRLVEARQLLAEGRRDEARFVARRCASLPRVALEAVRADWEEAGFVVRVAPREADEEVARMVHAGEAWAAASKDYDVFLHGAPRVVKHPRDPLVKLGRVLQDAGVRSVRSLVEACVLAGHTDYAPAAPGVRGFAEAVRAVDQAGGLHGFLSRQGVVAENPWSAARGVYLARSAA